MKKQMFKNVQLLLTERDKKNLEEMLRDPAHQDLNVSLEPIMETDDEGRITFFMPAPNTKWGLIFYFQNLMIQQRLHQIDEFLERQKANTNE
jgi:hypothetical protein